MSILTPHTMLAAIKKEFPRCRYPSGDADMDLFIGALRGDHFPDVSSERFGDVFADVLKMKDDPLICDVIDAVAGHWADEIVEKWSNAGDHDLSPKAIIRLDQNFSIRRKNANVEDLQQRLTWIRQTRTPDERAPEEAWIAKRMLKLQTAA